MTDSSTLPIPFVHNIQCPLIPPGMDHMKQECTDVSKWHSDLRGREFLFLCFKHGCPSGGLWVAVRAG